MVAQSMSQEFRNFRRKAKEDFFYLPEDNDLKSQLDEYRFNSSARNFKHLLGDTKLKQRKPFQRKSYQYKDP
jgi:hypothetical protein